MVFQREIIYSLMHNDFSFFEKFILDFKNKNLDDVRKIIQLVCQSIAFPFVISSSLFKIMTDWIIVYKERKAISYGGHLSLQFRFNDIFEEIHVGFQSFMMYVIKPLLVLIHCPNYLFRYIKNHLNLTKATFKK